MNAERSVFSGHAGLFSNLIMSVTTSGRRYVTVLVALVLAYALIYHTYFSLEPDFDTFDLPAPEQKPSVSSESQTSLINTERVTYNLSSEALWTEPLGHKLCFVDIDNRGFDGPNQLLNNGPFKWADFGASKAGVMNHYLYALTHGYSYHFIREKGYTDRHGTWSKFQPLQSLLAAGERQFVVVMDSDTIIMDLHLPFEWLLIRWQVGPNTSFTVAKDPANEPQNFDSKGRINDNTGFMVVQNLPATFEIIQDVISCPERLDRYPSCDKFKMEWPHEQGAFSEFVRYDYADHVQEINCTEANGYPGSGRQDCDGVFIRHFWDRKGGLKDMVNYVLSAPIVAMAHERMLTPAKQVVLDLTTNS